MRPDAVLSAGLLREARLRAGLSQVELAARSAKDRVQINRYEAGAVAPSLDVLVELVRACGFELGLDLRPIQDGVDADRLTELARLSPERRLERMLGPQPSGAGGRRGRKTFDPVAILAALEDQRVSYVLIGGLAQVLRGADLSTAGIDICPAFGRDNLDRLSRALQTLHARARDRTPMVVDEETLASQPAVEVSTSRGELKVVGAPAGVPSGFVELRRDASTEDLGAGVRPLVASAGDLAAMATALGRQPDLERARMLRRIVELEAGRPLAASAPRSRRPAGRPVGRRGPRLAP